MRREAGTSKYPEEEVLEHTRHTATGMLFFLSYDNIDHYCVADALRYLLSRKSQTPAGLWVDHGPKDDDSVDPVTVAFIVGALEQSRCILVGREDPAASYAVGLDELDMAIERGIAYLFDTQLRTEDGLWIYRYTNRDQRARVLDNVYQYTTDVLINISLTCKRLGTKSEAVATLLSRLFETAGTYSGLPRSPSSNVVDLDATASLIAAAKPFDEFAGARQEVLRLATDQCQDPAVVEGSAANGWGAFLAQAREPIGKHLRLEAETQRRIDALADSLLLGDPRTVSIPGMAGVREKYVRSLLLRRHGVQPR